MEESGLQAVVLPFAGNLPFCLSEVGSSTYGLLMNAVAQGLALLNCPAAGLMVSMQL